VLLSDSFSDSEKAKKTQRKGIEKAKKRNSIEESEN